MQPRSKIDEKMICSEHAVLSSSYAWQAIEDCVGLAMWWAIHALHDAWAHAILIEVA